MSNFEEQSAFGQELERQREAKSKPAPVDPAKVRQQIAAEYEAALQRHSRVGKASEQDIMEMRADLDMALNVLRIGDIGSATSIIQQIYDRLYSLLP